MENTSTGNGTENHEDEIAPVSTRDVEEDYLAALQKSLAGRVASLRIVLPERGSPYLEVVAKGPEKTSADVWVASADGVWWFWWGVPWSQRFGRADEPDRAAETLLRKLGGDQ